MTSHTETMAGEALVTRAELLERVARTIRTKWPVYEIGHHAGLLLTLYGSIIEGHRERFALIEADGRAVPLYRQLSAAFPKSDPVWGYVVVTWGDKHDADG